MDLESARILVEIWSRWIWVILVGLVGIWWEFGSDVLAPAWPESPGFGLALGSSGLRKLWAMPKAKSWAWLGLALAQARAFDLYTVFDHEINEKK